MEMPITWISIQNGIVVIMITHRSDVNTKDAIVFIPLKL